MEQKFNLFLLLPTLLCSSIYYTFIHLKTRNEALNNFFTALGRSINRGRKRFFKRLFVIRNFTLISFIPPPTSRQNFITRFTNINQLWLTGAGEDKRNTRQNWTFFLLSHFVCFKYTFCFCTCFFLLPAEHSRCLIHDVKSWKIRRIYSWQWVWKMSWVVTLNESNRLNFTWLNEFMRKLLCELLAKFRCKSFFPCECAIEMIIQVSSRRHTHTFRFCCAVNWGLTSLALSTR